MKPLQKRHRLKAKGRYIIVMPPRKANKDRLIKSAIDKSVADHLPGIIDEALRRYRAQQKSEIMETMKAFMDHTNEHMEDSDRSLQEINTLLEHHSEKLRDIIYKLNVIHNISS